MKWKGKIRIITFIIFFKKFITSEMVIQYREFCNKIYIIFGTWELRVGMNISFIFFNPFLCLDKFNINMNEMKNDFDRNEIPPISEISIYF